MYFTILFKLASKENSNFQLIQFSAIMSYCKAKHIFFMTESPRLLQEL